MSSRRSTAGRSGAGSRYRPGQRVHAKFRGGSKYFAGAIAKVNRDNSYDIEYDDGDYEKGVPEGSIRTDNTSAVVSSMAGATSEEDTLRSEDEGALERGTKVQARFRGGSKWYNGTILKENRDGTYHIKYEDGDQEPRVERRLIKVASRSTQNRSNSASRRSRSPSGDSPRPMKLVKELKAKGSSRQDLKRYRDAFKLYDSRGDGNINGRDFGRVLNGFKVRFSPGDLREAMTKFGDGLRVDYNRLLREVQGGAAGSDEDEDEEDFVVSKFRRGEAVTARFKGGRKFFPGKIETVNPDGTCNIHYDDGDREKNVRPSSIKKSSKYANNDDMALSPRGSGNVDTNSLKTILKRALRQSGNATVSEQKIMNLQDSFEMIDQDAKGVVSEREFERSVGKMRIGLEYNDIRKISAELSSGGNVKYGPFIKALRGLDSPHEGRSRFDSDNELLDNDTGVFKKGQKVRARYKRGRKMYPGVIARVRPNGRYDINYDDGETETSVMASMIEKADSFDTSGNEDDLGTDDDYLRKGDRVKAKYKGGTKLYPGVVDRVRPNGSCDILYDDGDTEQRVPRRSIQKDSSGRASPSRSSRKGSFRKGETIEALYKGGRKYYKGCISRVNVDGTYDILYDDGDRETKVAAEKIRKTNAGGSDSEGDADTGNGKPLRVGMKVKARFKGGRKYYEGQIKRKNPDGTYAIKYQDGDTERSVSRDKIIPLDQEDAGEEEDDDDPLGRGDRVEARYKGGSKFYKGKISRVNVNGSYDISYDDGDSERGVKARDVRRLGGGNKSARMGRGTSPRDEEDEDTPLGRGDRVEARYKGGSKFYKGKIQRVNVNGSYDISYDDGDSERGVKARDVRRLGGKKVRLSPSASKRTSPRSSSRLGVGSRVEAKYKGGSKFFKGKITKENLDGSFDIDYDDGDRERRVPARNIRSLDPVGMDSGVETPEDDMELARGDKVEAKYKGGRKYYKGEITRVNVDGSYDIRYDDGDRETRVKRSSIRPLNKRSVQLDTEEEDGAFSVGSQVEAKFKGGSKYYKGKITRVNSNGTYNISYVDGDRETQVKASFIRSLGKSGANKRSKSPKVDYTSDEDTAIKEGDRVEAKFKGGSKYFKGTVTRVNRNGSYAIDYDDGDKEKFVRAKDVKKLAGSPRASRKGSDTEDEPGLSKGDRVEARYKGGSKYYKGRISRVNRDGTYDIKYDDGDAEFMVRKSSIKSLERARSSRSPSKSRNRRGDPESMSDDSSSGQHKVGDKVEARFKGGAKYYKGKIARVNSDGTYAINYDDGDREPRVKASMIKGKPSRSRSRTRDEDIETTDGGLLQKGDRVEARYKGGRKFYKGVISRVRPDGSCDISYDDGDSEMRVRPADIRPLSASSPKHRRSSSPSKRRSSSPSKRRSSSRRRGGDSSSGSDSGSDDDTQQVLKLLSSVLKRAVADGTLRNYRDAFDAFDRNGDGVISHSEFSRSLKKLRVDVTRSQLRTILDKLDKDGDGRICYNEFIKLVKRHEKRGPSKRRTSGSESSSSGSESSNSEVSRRGRGRSSSRGRRRASRSKSKSKRSKSRRRSVSSGSSSNASVWSTSSGESEDDENWESDEPQYDERMDNFRMYFGKAILKDTKKRYKRAFEKLDRKGKGKIEGKLLNKALKSMHIKKHASKKLVKKLIKTYGDGSSSILYRDLITGCKEMAQNGGATTENESQAKKADSIIEKLQILCVDKDLEKELSKLDKMGEETVKTKTLVTYLLKLGFKKSQKRDLEAFVGHFDEESTGKVQYHDFVSYCMSKHATRKSAPRWKQATAGVDIANGLRALREERERQEQEGTDPLVWQVLIKLRTTISDAMNAGLAKDYSDAFEMFDLDKDGKISHDEMAKSLEKIGFDVNGEEVTRIMKKLDPDGEGRGVDYRHFLMFCTRGSDRDQWALNAQGEIVGSTCAGDLETSVRMRIRKATLAKKTGRNTVLKVFKNVDTTSSGFVSRKSLRKIASNLKWNLTNEDLACLIARFSNQGEDKFAYKKFINFLTLDDDAIYGLEQRMIEFVESMLQKGSSLKEIFGLFNRKGDGKITSKELCNAMIKIGFAVGKNEADELIRRVDINRDGKINLVEFTRAFAPAPPKKASTALVQVDENQDRSNVSQRNDSLTSAFQLANQSTFTSGVYSDWTDGLVATNGSIPVAPKGSVGEWLEKVASPLEKNNFFAFLNLISNFEKRIGLQQSRKANETNNGEIVVQLGSQLKVSMKFIT